MTAGMFADPAGRALVAAIHTRKQGADMAENYTPPPVPYDQHEREILAVINERDVAQAWADLLAAALAPEEVLGEHSNMNNPWANAIEHAASQTCHETTGQAAHQEGTS